MSEQGKRRHSRFSVSWSVEIGAANWRDVLQLSTLNVSRGGIFVCAEQPLDRGTRVDVTLILPDETVFQVEGEVAHRLLPAEAVETGREPGFGVRFDERYLDELRLLELMAANELATPSEAYRQQGDYVILPATLREEGGHEQSTTVYGGSRYAMVPDRDRAERANGGLSAQDTVSYSARDTVPYATGQPLAEEVQAELERGGASVAPPPVDLGDFKKAPAPPPADAELAQSGLYPRAEMPQVPPPQRKLEARPADRAPTPAAGTPATNPRLLEPVIPPPTPPQPPPVPAERPPTAAKPPAKPAARGAMPPVFGIDFGTSFTSVAVVRGDRVKLLEDSEGSTLIPSVVCYPDEGDPLVGWPAREKSLTHPTTTFRSPKRVIGKRYDDKRVDPFLGASPVRTQSGPNGQIVAEVYGELLAIPQVCAEIFKHVATVARESSGMPIEHVLLSAPVSFDKERVAIKRAAELAGLHVVGVIDEPVAAAMAYGVVRAGDGLVAVYDFGGGTFDFTVLEVKNGKSSVIGEAGDDWLGGDDFDRAIAEQAATIFARQYNVDLRKRAVEWERLLMHCEQAKRKLSVQEEFDLHVKGIVLSVRGGIDLRMHLDRQLFADICGPLVERSIEVIASCLELLEVQPSEISQLVLTGGVARIPLVRQRVQEYFKQKARMAVNPEHAIVLGNAIYGHVVRQRSGMSQG